LKLRAVITACNPDRFNLTHIQTQLYQSHVLKIMYFNFTVE
jgi:hypothetical protein